VHSALICPTGTTLPGTGFSVSTVHTAQPKTTHTCSCTCASLALLQHCCHGQAPDPASSDTDGRQTPTHVYTPHTSDSWRKPTVSQPNNMRFTAQPGLHQVGGGGGWAAKDGRKDNKNNNKNNTQGQLCSRWAASGGGGWAAKTTGTQQEQQQGTPGQPFRPTQQTLPSANRQPAQDHPCKHNLQRVTAVDSNPSRPEP
jgi:hypothetical protein